MSTVAAHLTALVTEAARRRGLLAEGDALEPVVPTRDASHGDYQSNAAFRLAKAGHGKPPEIAKALAEALPDDPALAGASVAGPGFLNLALRDEWLAADVMRRAADPRLLTPLVGAGRTMVLDYSSPNIAKRMHVGHIRSTVIGSAIDRIYRFLGWTVVADNHVGDWGTPYGKLMVAWKIWRDDAAYAADPVGELQRLYQKADAEIEADPTLLDRARAETVKLQAKDPESLALWRQFVDATFAEFDGIYERLGCRFDVRYGESHYADLLQPLVDELLAKGVAERSDGAVVIKFGADAGKGLADTMWPIRKADGAALYSTTDLATVRLRVETWHPERIVYVVDTRQQLHFKQVFAAARQMGIGDVLLLHLWFGMLKFPDGEVASTRKGSLVNLVDLLDTAASKAYDVVNAKAPDLPEDEKRRIAEVIGSGTIKYFDLSQNPQSDVTFSWEKALSLDGGSAVYLQYAYARLHSILRKAGVADQPPTALPAVSHPAERALAVLVARTAEVVPAAAELYRPNAIAEHLDQLAKAVGPFYESCPVLAEGVAPEVRAARLSLVASVAHTLSVGLDLLGIGVVPRM